jgi:hypothetical protein
MWGTNARGESPLLPLPTLVLGMGCLATIYWSRIERQCCCLIVVYLLVFDLVSNGKGDAAAILAAEEEKRRGGAHWLTLSRQFDASGRRVSSLDSETSHAICHCQRSHAHTSFVSHETRCLAHSHLLCVCMCVHWLGGDHASVTLGEGQHATCVGYSNSST